MKLTIEDKKYLSETLHESDESISQIERAIGKTTFEHNEKRISAKKAVELLGRKDFLSGMDRCAFHWSAVREADDGSLVYFDASRFFRD